MTKFIDVSTDTPKEENKTVFTHFLSNGSGWEKAENTVDSFQYVKYLGECIGNGDMFLAITHGCFTIYKGKKGDEFNR